MEASEMWNELRERILRRLTPSEEEEEALKSLCQRLEDDVTRLLEEARIEGARRGAWLSGEGNMAGWGEGHRPVYDTGPKI
jgi:tRNA nucleotidyltransferase (CCA-adding enzyme)